MEEAEEYFIVYRYRYCDKSGVAFIKKYRYEHRYENSWHYHYTVCMFIPANDSCNTLARLTGEFLSNHKGKPITFMLAKEFKEMKDRLNNS